MLAFSSYGFKGPVYLKDKSGQVVTPHVNEDSVVFAPGRVLKCYIVQQEVQKLSRPAHFKSCIFRAGSIVLLFVLLSS